jgi:glucose 1-dehydrogenase
MIQNGERHKPKISPVADRLKGKVTLVTGGANGIGRAIALHFAHEGSDIAIGDIAANGEATAEEVRALGRRCIFVHTDISDRGQVEHLVDAVLTELQQIDILINNAGMIVFGSLLECRINDWDKMLAVDLTGCLHCAQFVGKHMKERNQGGRMIHIGSTASMLPTEQQGAYCVAKAGLSMLSMMAAMELAPFAITSNLLCSGAVVTGINRELLTDPALMARLEGNVPLGRLGTTEEMAAAAAFLASDDAAYITGAELAHDGGVTKSALWWR